MCSAGLETAAGKPANPTAISVAQDHGLILDGHATALLSADLAMTSDLIVVMELGRKYRITRVYPQAKGKVELLGILTETNH